MTVTRSMCVHACVCGCACAPRVKLKGSEKNLEGSDVWKAAVCIQRRWRGYRTRNLNSDVLTGCKDIQLNRMQEYIL